MIPAETDVFKTSSGCLKKVTTSYYQTRLGHDFWQKTSDLRRLEVVQFMTSWRRLIYDVFRRSDLQRPDDVWFTSSWWRQIRYVLKSSDLQRLQDADLRRLEDVRFTSSWRRLIYDILKTSDLWRLEDIFKTTSRSDVYTASKETIFSCFVLSEVFRKF